MSMNRTCYPLLLAPDAGSISVDCSIANGHRYKKGLSETIAYSHLIGEGLDMLRDDVSVTIDGTRYEPDLVFLNESRNIRIDIEVDEPYSAKGMPTHFCDERGVSKDEQRNRRFCTHGWYVLRFTEEQLFRFPASCASIIANLLYSLGEIKTVPERLRKAPALEPVPQWTREEARQMSEKGYRNGYIGFSPGEYDLLRDRGAIASIGFSMLSDVLRNPKAMKAVLTSGNIRNLIKH